jgi:hypothetical protein
MHQGTQFYLQQQVRQLESMADGNRMRLARARTLREVMTLAHAPVPSVLQFMRHQIHALRRLEQAAQERAETLVREQLGELAVLPDDELRKRVGELRSREWVLLRGKFPSLVHLTDREVQRLLREAGSGAAGPAAVDGENS